MRRFAALAVLFATAAAAQPGAWRPAPVTGATEPSEVVAHSAATDWRPVDPENLLVMELADGAKVYIELAPDFAPVHVANIRRYARGGWWNGATIYRVQDNYVTQWGNGDASVPLPRAWWPGPRPNMSAAAKASPSARSAFPTATHRRPATLTAGRSPTIRSAPAPGSPIAMPASASAETWRPTPARAASSTR